MVVAIGRHRDYYVKMPSGRVFWRNRRFLRPYVPPAPALAVEPFPEDQSHRLDHGEAETRPDYGMAKTHTADTGNEPRCSARQRHKYHPFNISSTRGKSYH